VKAINLLELYCTVRRVAAAPKRRSSAKTAHEYLGEVGGMDGICPSAPF